MFKKLTNERCPKCGLKNVFRYIFDVLAPPMEEDLEEGKIIFGIGHSYLQCSDCRWEGELEREKIY
jgi:hypothetical protein